MDGRLYSRLLNIGNMNKKVVLKNIINYSRSYLGSTTQKCKLYARLIYQK